MAAGGVLWPTSSVFVSRNKIITHPNTFLGTAQQQCSTHIRDTSHGDMHVFALLCQCYIDHYPYQMGHIILAGCRPMRGWHWFFFGCVRSNRSPGLLGVWHMRWVAMLSSRARAHSRQRTHIHTHSCNQAPVKDETQIARCATDSEQWHRLHEVSLGSHKVRVME